MWKSADENRLVWIVNFVHNFLLIWYSRLLKPSASLVCICIQWFVQIRTSFNMTWGPKAKNACVEEWIFLFSDYEEEKNGEKKDKKRKKQNRSEALTNKKKTAELYKRSGCIENTPPIWMHSDHQTHACIPNIIPLHSVWTYVPRSHQKRREYTRIMYGMYYIIFQRFTT